MTSGRGLQPRLIIVALTIISIVALWALVIAYSTQGQLRDAVCGTFTDVAQSPLAPNASPLAHNLVRDTAHGARVAKCPGSDRLPQ